MKIYGVFGNIDENNLDGKGDHDVVGLYEVQSIAFSSASLNYLIASQNLSVALKLNFYSTLLD